MMKSNGSNPCIRVLLLIWVWIMGATAWAEKPRPPPLGPPPPAALQLPSPTQDASCSGAWITWTGSISRSSLKFLKNPHTIPREVGMNVFQLHKTHVDWLEKLAHPLRNPQEEKSRLIVLRPRQKPPEPSDGRAFLIVPRLCLHCRRRATVQPTTIPTFHLL